MRSELPTAIALAAALAGCALAGGDAASAEVETLELPASLHGPSSPRRSTSR